MTFTKLQLNKLQFYTCLPRSKSYWIHWDLFLSRYNRVLLLVVYFLVSSFSKNYFSNARCPCSVMEHLCLFFLVSCFLASCWSTRGYFHLWHNYSQRNLWQAALFAMVFNWQESEISMKLYNQCKNHEMSQQYEECLLAASGHVYTCVVENKRRCMCHLEQWQRHFALFLAMAQSQVF